MVDGYSLILCTEYWVFCEEERWIYSRNISKLWSEGEEFAETVPAVVEDAFAGGGFVVECFDDGCEAVEGARTFAKTVVGAAYVTDTYGDDEDECADIGCACFFLQDGAEFLFEVGVIDERPQTSEPECKDGHEIFDHATAFEREGGERCNDESEADDRACALCVEWTMRGEDKAQEYDGARHDERAEVRDKVS